MSALLLLIGVFQYVFMQQFMYQNKAETIRNQLAALPPNVWLRAEEGQDRGQSPFLPKQELSMGTIGRINFGGRFHGFLFLI